uniref:Uncharacterized protein n=1 Tax=Romanomermis culicivorax TaxID=13658 RepID=A0A915L8U7_ROMCU
MQSKLWSNTPDLKLHNMPDFWGFSTGANSMDAVTLHKKLSLMYSHYFLDEKVLTIGNSMDVIILHEKLSR